MRSLEIWSLHWATLHIHTVCNNKLIVDVDVIILVYAILYTQFYISNYIYPNKTLYKGPR